MFNPSSAPIFKTINLSRVFPLGIVRFFEIFFFLLFVVSLISIQVYSIFDYHLSLLIAYWSFLLWGVFFLYRCFFNQKLKNPEIKNPENLAEFLDFEAAEAVNFALTKKGDFTMLLLFYLASLKKLLFVFERLGLDQKEMQKELKKRLKGTKKDTEEIEETLSVILKETWRKITIFDLFGALVETEPLFKKFLDPLQLSRKDVKEVCRWQESILEREMKEKRFWEMENLLKHSALFQDWAAGYTITLDNFSIDITKMEKPNLLPSFFLHKKELEKLENALIKSERSCALLVGEVGVGRKEIIKNFARKINQGKSLPSLNYQRVVEIDMASVLSAGREMGDIEQFIRIIFDEAIRAGNVILVIRQIHNFIGFEFGAESIGKIDISSVLNQYLSIPGFRLIGITTYEGFHRAIEKVPELQGQFEKIEVNPPSKEETLRIVEDEILKIEKRAQVFFPFRSIKEIVELSDKYIQTIPFPKKAIDLLEELIIYALRIARTRKIQPEVVEAFISEKTEIPVGKVAQQEKEILLNLENLIHQRLVNQEEAVSEIANALRRARAGIQERKKPIGNFLFLGPTGVGKTETAKCLARIYFGSEKRIIRLDMSEYQTLSSISRLIGTAREPGYFTTQIREDPFSLVLLDEIEKSHPSILNLFLQVLDEGFLTDGAGKTVDFKNTIIIATSNAGAELIRQAVLKGRDLMEYKEEFINEILMGGIFKPEFLNRFDAVVLYKPLSKEHFQKIAALMIKDIQNGLLEKNIEFSFDSELVVKIAEIGYNPEFGAREMKRVVQNKLENNIAKAILAGEIKEGDKITIDPANFEVKKIKKEIVF